MSVISRRRWRMSIPLALILLALIASLVFALSSRGFIHAAGSLIQISSEISVLRLPPMVGRPGNMAPCLAPPSTQYRQIRSMPARVMPRLPSMPSTTSG